MSLKDISSLLNTSYYIKRPYRFEPLVLDQIQLYKDFILTANALICRVIMRLRSTLTNLNMDPLLVTLQIHMRCNWLHFILSL